MTRQQKVDVERVPAHRGEYDTVRLEVGNTDPEELSAGLQVPDADATNPTGGENFAELAREGEAVDLVAMRCLDQLLDKSVGRWQSWSD
jgi:hypothetical protein